jgi:phage terminase small subunit
MDFVEAYLSNGGNATEAALAAGFSPHTAARQGGRMVKDVRVLSVLDKRREIVFDNLKITTERILLERARLAFFDPRKLLDKDGIPIPLHLLDDDTAAAIAGLDVMQMGDENSVLAVVKKYKLADKNASLTSLEKQKGMYEKDNEQSRHVTKVVMVPPKRCSDD